ncbi:MAG: FprA family A-type flavoprotein [Paramuribaculum sp.]|nr:FprA family A-type flavoprotein [Paramuribaculum sp.]
MINNISDSIRYVGVDDTDLQLFENQYPVPKGISYNSYIIIDSKIVLFDTVERDFGDEWLAKIRLELGDRTPDYLIVHHMEPDHSSNIVRALDEFPEMTLIATKQAINMLPQFFGDYNFDGRTMAVKDGDTLPVGDHEIVFSTAPMVHWPEVLVSYEKSEKVLFTADAFGKFGSTEYDDDWVSEARRYYINIVGKYGVQTQNLLKKLSGLEARVIAPLHGPVLKGDLSKYISLYDTWSSYKPETDGVMVAYASVYGGTKQCALEFADILRAKGVENVVTFDLCCQELSEAVSQAFRMSTLVIASVTYDASLFPPMYHFLHHLKMKNYRNRRVAIIENGSWAPVAGKLMTEAMSALPDIEIVPPMITIKSRMNDSTRKAMNQLAEAIVIDGKVSD